VGLGSGVVVAVAVAAAGSSSSNSTPILGTSICCTCGHKKNKRERERERTRENIRQIDSPWVCGIDSNNYSVTSPYKRVCRARGRGLVFSGSFFVSPSAK